MKSIFRDFQGLLVAKNCLRSETAPLTKLTIKRGLLCNAVKTFNDRYFIGHSGTNLKFSITTEL